MAHIVGCSICVFEQLLTVVIKACQLHGEPSLEGGPVLSGLDQLAWLQYSTLDEPPRHQPACEQSRRRKR